MATPRSHAEDNHEKVDASSRKKPCRSCLDFKAWRAQMQGKTNAASGTVSMSRIVTICDVCKLVLEDLHQYYATGASDGRPNLQNFVRCTYENVTKKSDIRKVYETRFTNS